MFRQTLARLSLFFAIPIGMIGGCALSNMHQAASTPPPASANSVEPLTITIDLPDRATPEAPWLRERLEGHDVTPEQARVETPEGAQQLGEALLRQLVGQKLSVYSKDNGYLLSNDHRHDAKRRVLLLSQPNKVTASTPVYLSLTKEPQAGADPLTWEAYVKLIHSADLARFKKQQRELAKKEMGALLGKTGRVTEVLRDGAICPGAVAFSGAGDLVFKGPDGDMTLSDALILEKSLFIGPKLKINQWVVPSLVDEPLYPNYLDDWRAYVLLKPSKEPANNNLPATSSI